MEKFKELQQKCKCSVSIEVNRHRDFYQKADDYIDELNLFDTEIDQGVIDKMIELDTIVEIQCYVHTPIGFLKVTHYDVDIAIDLMIEAVNNNL